MDNEYDVYETFITTNRFGDEIELAIVDKFDFEDRHFVAAAQFKDDTICEDGLFVYECIGEGEEVSIEKISDPDEYTRIAEAYASMEE